MKTLRLLSYPPSTIKRVIIDSIPWKEELLKVADRLEAKLRQKVWAERSFFLVERDVMTSAYAIRKLIEAFKVSDELRDKMFPVVQYPMNGDHAPDWLDRFDFEEFYDLESPSPHELSVREICNQIIHSWLWTISFDEHTQFLEGFLVSSDRESRKRLFFIDAATYIERCREIGYEDVYSKRSIRGPDGRHAFSEILGRQPMADAEEEEAAPPR